MRVGKFAAGSIAMLDYNAPKQNNLPGLEATSAVKLNSKRLQLVTNPRSNKHQNPWRLANRGVLLQFLVMGVLVGCHLALIPIVALLGNTVLVKDATPISVAKFLKRELAACIGLASADDNAQQSSTRLARQAAQCPGRSWQNSFRISSPTAPSRWRVRTLNPSHRYRWTACISWAC